MKNQDIIGLLKGMLKEKGTVMETLANAIDESARIQKGLGKVRDSVFDNPSEENLRKQLHITMKSLETQSKTITQLALISLVYVANSNFTSDLAISLGKLEHGRVALQEMFRQKMEGK